MCILLELHVQKFHWKTVTLSKKLLLAKPTLVLVVFTWAMCISLLRFYRPWFIITWDLSLLNQYWSFQRILSWSYLAADLLSRVRIDNSYIFTYKFPFASFLGCSWYLCDSLMFGIIIFIVIYYPTLLDHWVFICIDTCQWDGFWKCCFAAWFPVSDNACDLLPGFFFGGATMILLSLDQW